MKHVIFSVILAVTLPVFAADPPTTLSPQPQPVVQQDSPLVAAAKRTHRLGKKPTLLITNENLAHMDDSRGFTTTTAQQPVTAPKGTVAPTPEMQAAAAAQKAREAQAQNAAQQQRARDARAQRAGEAQSMYDGDNYLDADPAQHEHAMDSMSQSQPAPASSSAPRQSSNTSSPQPSNSNQKPPQE